jgi:hypothetical protein
MDGACTGPHRPPGKARRCRRVLGAAEGDVTGAGAGAIQVGLHMGRQDGAYRPKGLVQQQGRGLEGGERQGQQGAGKGRAGRQMRESTGQHSGNWQ